MMADMSKRPEWLQGEKDNRVFRVGKGPTLIVALNRVEEDDPDIPLAKGDVSFSIWEEDGTYYNGGFFTPEDPEKITISDIMYTLLHRTLINWDVYQEI